MPPTLLLEPPVERERTETPDNLCYRTVDKTTSAKLIGSISQHKAREFWDVGRPYFFAVLKSKIDDVRAVDLENLSKMLSDSEGLLIHLDANYEIYVVKPADEKSIFCLPKLSTLRGLGVPDLLVKNLWSLNDENDHDAIWNHSSRITLIMLFTYENSFMGRDKALAETLKNGFPKESFPFALNITLFLAAYGNEVGFLRMLLDYGADPNSYTDGIGDCRTALASAVDRQCYATAEELLRWGADPDFSANGDSESGREAALGERDEKALSLFDRYRTR